VNWSATKKEVYAIVASLVKWVSWIGTKKAAVMTDHRAYRAGLGNMLEPPQVPLEEELDG
jgi:hypothetical protein